MRVAPVTRRTALGRLATLLAAGLWPGQLCAAPAEKLELVVLNDLHHAEPACDPWFEALFETIRSRHPRASACLALGDLAHRGARESLRTIAALGGRLPMRFAAVPGNHDNDLDGTTRVYAEVFPGQLNQAFEQNGWQIILVDTTQGTAWNETNVSAETLHWLDETLSGLDRRRPTVIGTHFPLAANVRMCPLNAEAVLERFEPFNLRAVLSGHYHAHTESRRGETALFTHVCCSRVAGNHDGSLEKGYSVFRGEPDGQWRREFVPFTGA